MKGWQFPRKAKAYEVKLPTAVDLWDVAAHQMALERRARSRLSRKAAWMREYRASLAAAGINDDRSEA